MVDSETRLRLKKKKVFCKAEENINCTSKNLLFEKVHKNQEKLEQIVRKLSNFQEKSEKNLEKAPLILISEKSKCSESLLTQTPFTQRKVDTSSKKETLLNKIEDLPEEIVKFNVTPEKLSKKPIYSDETTLTSRKYPSKPLKTARNTQKTGKKRENCPKVNEIRESEWAWPADRAQKVSEALREIEKKYRFLKKQTKNSSFLF